LEREIDRVGKDEVIKLVHADEPGIIEWLEAEPVEPGRAQQSQLVEVASHVPELA
jgi:hypothetical protein